MKGTMSRIVSPVEKINNLWIDGLPSGKAVAIVRAVKVEGVTFMLGKNGKLYCDRISGRGVYLLHRYGFTDSLCRAMRSLGVITQAEAQQHMDAANLATKKSEFGELAGQFRYFAKKVGIELTRNQTRMIARKAKELQAK